MKYIIKNCPACILDPSCCAQWHINNRNAKDCSDITDCLMKQIVENLKTCLEDNTCDNCDGVGYYDGCEDIKCAYYQARKCLELLEIEECENEQI